MSRLYYAGLPKEEMAPGGGGGGGVIGAEIAEKIGKLIPSELLAGYAALASLTMALERESWRLPVFGLCFVICWVLTPFYLNKVADPGKPKRNHLIVSTLAFPVWAYQISGAVVIPQWHDPGLATIIALVFSLVTALVPMDK